MTMKFAGLIKQSLVDYPGEIAAVLFSRGCNMVCPFCHNGHLIPGGKDDKDDISEQQVEQFLADRADFLDGVVFSGGEPTLKPDLPKVMESVKKQGYLIKLDTNGTNTAMLQELLQKNLVDYVAMDIKAPLEYKKYQYACGGRLSSQNFMNIRSSLQLLLQQEIKVEFRTTVVPALHRLPDVVEIAENIKGTQIYTLQQFNPENPWDANLRFSSTYSKKELQKMAEQCGVYVHKVRVLTYL